MRAVTAKNAEKNENAGFKAIGIFPLNRYVFNDHEYAHVDMDIVSGDEVDGDVLRDRESDGHGTNSDDTAPHIHHCDPVELVLFCQVEGTQGTKDVPRRDAAVHETTPRESALQTTESNPDHISNLDGDVPLDRRNPDTVVTHTHHTVERIRVRQAEGTNSASEVLSRAAAIPDDNTVTIVADVHRTKDGDAVMPRDVWNRDNTSRSKEGDSTPDVSLQGIEEILDEFEVLATDSTNYITHQIKRQPRCTKRKYKRRKTGDTYIITDSPYNNSLQNTQTKQIASSAK